MELEVRAITTGEIDDFIWATPSVAGLPTWEPEPAAWWAGPGVGPSFGTSAEEDLARYRAELTEPDRVRAAFVDGKMVGTSAVFSLEITIPGAGPVPLGGVTAIGVRSTHRRRGILRAMMRSMLDDCHERGEYLAGLGSSEGTIYGRYGFGPATFQMRWELDRTEATFAQPPGVHDRIDLVDGPTIQREWAAFHDRVRAGRTGEVSAHGGFWPGVATPTGAGAEPKQWAVHRDAGGTVDGAAVFRIRFSPDPATAGTVQVQLMDAATPDAYAELWAFLCDLDLTKRVVAGMRPVDEPLRWLLVNPRALRVTRLSDNLWVRLVDVPRALAARTYATEGSVVLDVEDAFCPWNTGRWRLDAGPDGATCEREAGRDADLAVEVATLGSAYLGGTPLLTLARGGRVRELTPGATARASAMFATPETPRNTIGF